jgi:hypothetical protein
MSAVRPDNHGWHRACNLTGKFVVGLAICIGGLAALSMVPEKAVLEFDTR